ncbi:hypothetical protein GQ457_06G015470 [Hibiscus cannabinus]
MQQYCRVVLKQLRSQRPRKHQSRISAQIFPAAAEGHLNQPRKSAQAGPVVSCRDIPFVIQLKQIIEAPR